MAAASESYDYFFHSPQKASQGQPSTLSDREKTFYNYIASKTSPGQLFVYYNSEIGGNHGDFDYKGAAKGYAVSLPKRLPLNQLDHLEPGGEGGQFMLSSRWFSRIGVIKVPREAIPAGMRERDMKEIIQRLTPRLDGSSETFNQERITLAASFMGKNVRKHEGTKDVVAWQPGISGHGHFAGLYKNKNTTLAGGEDSYYLVVHSDSDVLGEALNGYAVQHRDLTLGQFASSVQMDGVRNYSERNSKRILAELADALQLRRDLVPVLEDLQSHPPAGSFAPPELASSLYTDTVYNYFYDPIADGNTLTYYNTVARLNALDQHGGRVAVLKNAKTGLAILALDPSKDYTVFRHSVMSNKDQSHLISHANPHAAIPIGLGKLLGDKTAALKASKLDSDDASVMYQAYEWGGKTRDPDLSSADQVVASLNPRLYTYRNVDSQVRTMIEFMVGSKTEVTTLKPVSVILPKS